LKLQILIHTHDTFKADAAEGVAIVDGRSHASLARQFLSGLCNDRDLLNMVQYHDEPRALWRQGGIRYHGSRYSMILGGLMAARSSRYPPDRRAPSCVRRMGEQPLTGAVSPPIASSN
jgi:hypothetical protein